jgi:hypothetical protein
MNTPISKLAPAEKIISDVTTGRPTGLVAAQPTSLSSAGSSQIRRGLSGISCEPKAVSVGDAAKCTIQVAPDSNSTEIRSGSSSEQVKLPSIVAARANQGSLTFLASVEPAAKLQSVTITATLGTGQVQDSHSGAAGRRSGFE